MTPEQKAKELFTKFYDHSPYQEIEFYSNNEMAKQCALIAVDEILEIIRYHGTDIGKHSLMFWNEVKQEILAL